MMWQLIAIGIVGYAPLVGTHLPLDLHVEDTTFTALFPQASARVVRLQGQVLPLQDQLVVFS